MLSVLLVYMEQHRSCGVAFTVYFLTELYKLELTKYSVIGGNPQLRLTKLPYVSPQQANYQGVYNSRVRSIERMNSPYTLKPLHMLM
jgi:hypothetical protein